MIEWFNKRFNVNIEKSQSIAGPLVSEETKIAVKKHLLSHNFAAVVGIFNPKFFEKVISSTTLNFLGYMYAVDTLKSVILTMACMEKFLPVEKAVLLARLEEEFQVELFESFHRTINVEYIFFAAGQMGTS